MTKASSLSRRQRLVHLSVVTVGVGLLGLGSYAVQLAVNRTAPAVDVAAFGSFWALTFGLVGGILLPFEQLMVRATAGGTPLGGPTSRRVSERGVVRFYLVVSVVLSAGLLLASGPLANYLLGGQRDLAYLLAAYVVLAFAQSYQRGRAVGCGRLDIYGRQLAIDGVFRLLVGGMLLLFGTGRPTLAGAGLLMAAAVSLPAGHLRRTAGAKAAMAGGVAVAREALLMSAASTLSLWLLNAGVIVVVASGAGPPLAAAFASIFIITRIPLLFQGSLQSIILASVVAHRNRGDIRGVRRTIHRSLALVGMSGVVTVVVFGLLADSWAAWLYGDRFQLGIVSSTGLALSTALFLVGAACHVMLVGLDASREATLAWIAGALAFGAVIWTGWGPPVPVVVSAYVTSAAVLIVVQAVLIRWVLARTALGISRE